MKVAWIFKPELALLIGSPGINIKPIQYVDLEIALIQQHCPHHRAQKAADFLVAAPDTHLASEERERPTARTANRFLVAWLG